MATAPAHSSLPTRNGKLLWHLDAGQSWKGGPMTYTVDGNQYIGAAAGSTILALACAKEQSDAEDCRRAGDCVRNCIGTDQKGAAEGIRVEGRVAEILRMIASDAKTRQGGGRLRFHRRAPSGIPRASCTSATKRRTGCRGYSPDGRVETVLEMGDPDGSTLDAHGRLVTTASVLRSIIQVDADGKYKVLASAYEGKKFNSPNDIILGPDKALYFRSDPGSAERREAGTCLSRRLSPRRRRVGASADEGAGAAQRPGVLSGRQRLYIDDTKQRLIRVYDVQPNGELANGRLFGKEEGRGGVPDGMRVDVNGNVFVTGPGGIWVWDPAGNHLGTILLPESAANLNWGDADYRTLYITARTSVYRLKPRRADLCRNRNHLVARG